MKFPIDICWDCGLDLTTAEPAEVTYPGNDQALAKCPKCDKLYFMLEVTPEVPKPEVTPEAPKPKGGRRKVSESQVEPEPPLEE